MGYPTPVLTAHYAEIALKGKNRPMFVKQLRENIEAALADEPVASIAHVESRLLIELSDPSRAEASAGKMRRVFGIEYLSQAAPVPRGEVGDDLASVSRVACALALEDRGQARDFKIECRRSDRGFPLTSPEICRIVGAEVQKAIDLPVRLQHPEFTVHLLVLKDNVLVFTRKISAHGGLPSGTGGRVAVLLSGGIDSPVAAWLLMKRGCHPELVHFYSGRTVEEADAQKIRHLAAILCEYSPVPLNLHLVPAYPYELRAIGNITSNYDMVLFRRYMVKTTERLARRFGCLALVTGDSLGQVASQTLHNLSAISSDVMLPIFRPLIGLDKHEITKHAIGIGTYETSILPYRDCCSIRSPRPILNARAPDLMRLSEDMELEAAIDEAVAGTASEMIAPETGKAGEITT